MKKALLSIALLSTTVLTAQNIVSVQNGNASNPLTWDCTCIPSFGSSIQINHNVTMDSDWIINSGGLIQVNATGTFNQSGSRSILVDGGGSGFYNFGTSTFDNFSFTNGGSGSNTGNFTINTALSITDGSEFVNNGGTISGINTFYNTGNFTNLNSGTFSSGDVYSSGEIINSSLFNADSIANSGTIDHINGNLNCTAIGTSGNVTIQYGHVTVAGNFYNSSAFTLIDGGNLHVLGAFYSSDDDSVGVSFINHGAVAVFQDFYNSQNVAGNGDFCVNGYSANSGNFSGLIDFCDATGTDFDLNSGTIAGSVTFCQPGCTASINEEEATASVYPNPTTDKLSILSNHQFRSASFYDVTGKLVREYSVIGQTISVDGLDAGTYLLVLKGNLETLPIRVVVE